MAFAALQSAQVSDQRGNHYRLWVESNGFSVRIMLAHRTKLVGMAQCVINSPQTLTLADITIYDNVLPRASALITAYRLLLRRPPRTVSYRGNGLGSLLLEHVKEYAREHGFMQITGLARSEQTPAPRLFHWYRRHGFAVDEAGNMCFEVAP